MSNVAAKYTTYLNAIDALSTTADSVYNSITTGNVLKLEKDSGEVTYVLVASKSKSLDNGSTYDVNVTGATIEVKSTAGYLPSGITISYYDSKTTKDILTNNTPQATDDPVTGTMMSKSEYSSDVSWRSNFYL